MLLNHLPLQEGISSTSTHNSTGVNKEHSTETKAAIPERTRTFSLNFNLLNQNNPGNNVNILNRTYDAHAGTGAFEGDSKFNATTQQAANTTTNMKTIIPSNSRGKRKEPRRVSIDNR